MAKPRFLRRHYPHQVQGVRSTVAPIISARRLPRTFFLVRIRLRQAKSIDCSGSRVDCESREFAGDTPIRLCSGQALPRYRPNLTSQGMMTADSSAVGRSRCCDGVGEIFAGVGASAGSPIRLAKLRSASGVTGSAGTNLVCRR